MNMLKSEIFSSQMVVEREMQLGFWGTKACVGMEEKGPAEWRVSH